ncbi:MAG: hypothetical protein QXP61_01005, partial [Nitrososphaerales archaeon]
MLDFLEKAPLMVSENVIFFVTISSVIATSIVAYYCFRFYRISDIGHFLGIPAGFTFLSASHALFATGFWIENTRLSNLLSWMWLTTLSYSFSLIAMSYYYRSAEFNERTKLVRTMTYAAMPLLGLLLAIELISLEQKLIPFKIIDEYFIGFNLIALAYIIIQCVTIPTNLSSRSVNCRRVKNYARCSDIGSFMTQSSL